MGMPGFPFLFCLKKTSFDDNEKMISLQFQHGGVYRYHLVQTSKDKENYTYDRSSYIIAVYIKNGENGKLVPQVIAEKNDGKKCGELMFYNSYNKRNI